LERLEEGAVESPSAGEVIAFVANEGITVQVDDARRSKIAARNEIGRSYKSERSQAW
jgi:hypothetical protein